MAALEIVAVKEDRNLKDSLTCHGGSMLSYPKWVPLKKEVAGCLPHRHLSGSFPTGVLFRSERFGGGEEGSRGIIRSPL